MRYSMGGTTTKDMDGITFLMKQIMDEDAMEMDMLQIVLLLVGCYFK